ncbi:MAG: DoxX family protein [Phycisphaeraceae bacterium]
MRLLLFGGPDHLSVPAEIGALALRVGAGLGLALGHGINKMPPSDGFITGVGEMGFPLPTLFAWMAGLAEFAGGLLVVLGLLTRPAALFATCTMATAFFIRHANDPFGDKELAMLYGLVMLMFCFAGAGRFSIDRMLRPGGQRAL